MSFLTLIAVSAATSQAGTIDTSKSDWTPLKAAVSLNQPITIDTETETTSGGIVAIGQDAKGNTVAINWSFTVEPLEDASKTAWLAVEDSDAFGAVDDVFHDAMRQDSASALTEGETLYALIEGDDSSALIVTAVVEQRDVVMGLDMGEIYNKGVYSIRAGAQIAKGSAKIATGNPWSVIEGSADVVGGFISLVVGLTSDDTEAFGNIWGWDDLEDALWDATKAAFADFLTWVFTDDDDAPADTSQSTGQEAEKETEPKEGTTDDADSTNSTDSSDVESDDSDCEDGDEGCGEEDDRATSGEPDFEDDADGEVMAQFEAIASILGIDPYNTDTMTELMGAKGDIGESDTIDAAFLEVLWLDYECMSSTDLCLKPDSDEGAVRADIVILDTLCEGGVCIGAAQGGALSDGGLDKLGSIKLIESAAGSVIETFESTTGK